MQTGLTDNSITKEEFESLEDLLVDVVEVIDEFNTVNTGHYHVYDDGLIIRPDRSNHYQIVNSIPNNRVGGAKPLNSIFEGTYLEPVEYVTRPTKVIEKPVNRFINKQVGDVGRKLMKGESKDVGGSVERVDVGKVTDSKSVYGPYYDEAKKLHENNPDWYPNPVESTIVKGKELKEARADYQALVRRGGLEKGHHKQGLAFGGENVNSNIKKTGESTIPRKPIDDLNLDFYHEMGYGKKDAKVLKIHENENGAILFGNNPQHTEVTTFQNKVLKWQRENGKR